MSSISKIFEKVIFKQLYSYFDTNNLFHTSQYGFRKGHSTELAVLEIVDRIIQEMDNGELPLNIYLDLSKAFDTLDFDILLYKLKHYGIIGIANTLFENYLNNRKQFVSWNDVNSQLKTIKTGVPQGSVLGPLLFLIYINDISNASHLFQFISYADDSTLFNSLKSFGTHTSKKINEELNNVCDWLKVNRLSLNADKTNFMIFHKRKKTHYYSKV